MARRSSYVAFLAAAVAFAPGPSAAQRPSLSGEKASVAEAVRADLTRLAQLQKTYHDRAKLYAADARDLRFTPTSGAQVNIAYASMNSWAANASHPTLAPVACYVIVSANDAADAESARPFCTEAKPGTPAGNVAAATASSGTARQAPPATQRSAAPVSASPPATNPQRQPTGTQRQPAATPRRPAATPASRANGSARANVPVVSGRTGDVPGEAQLMTREVVAGANAAERTQNVTPAEFADALAEFSRNALAILNTPAPVTVRDPYESTPEFEARRAAAIAAHEKREADFFRENTRTFVVQMPVRNVTYDPDREVVEFAIEPVKLPVTGNELSLACYTRPVFWCTAGDGMTYDAGDLWRVPRATARQHDVLRTPMTLISRYTVGRIEGERALAISLVDMDLQARGQSVQRWPSASR
jgi:hypothetical protein